VIGLNFLWALGDLSVSTRPIGVLFLMEKRPLPTAWQKIKTSPGTVIKAGTRGMDIGITTVGPVDEARHRVQ